jgi:hypothetical protein
MSGNIYNLPQIFNFANMPHHAFGLETLNSTKVLTNHTLEIKTNTNEDSETLSNHLFIKSVVTLKEKQDNNSSFIYGSKTFILNMITPSNTNLDGTNIQTLLPGQAVAISGQNMVYVYDPITKLISASAAAGAAAATLGAGNVAGQTAVAANAAAAPIMSAVRYINEEDKVKDFTTNQTILIYTNELSKSSSSNKALIKARYDRLKKLKTPEDPNHEYNPYFPGLSGRDQIDAWNNRAPGLAGATTADSVIHAIKNLPGDRLLLEFDTVGLV